MDHGGKIDEADSTTSRWPTWARVLATLALLYHASAVWAGAWAPGPASDLERRLDGLFDGYQQLLNQGVSYRYYSPEPPPTPVITATLAFADGRPDREVRIPERGTWPRLRYQRQLALASGLLIDSEEEARKPDGNGSASRWAHAFKTHLCRSNPGCSTVTLRWRLHLVPNPGRVRELLDESGGRPVDLDAEEFYTGPQVIGVYPCDAS